MSSTTDYRYGKPKSKKIDDHIDPKYFPPKEIGPDGKEIPWSDDPKTRAWILEYAANAKMREQEAKLEAKRHEEEQQIMQEREKKQREEIERSREIYSKTPQWQRDKRKLAGFISGELFKCGYCHMPSHHLYCTNPSCPVEKGREVGPEIRLARQKVRDAIRFEEAIREGRLIELDEQTRSRLVEFAKPDELISDLINRLLDIAVAVEAAE